jgi:tetratricopeptide (TPR) repeat protein/uncharacterized caspase-like protein
MSPSSGVETQNRYAICVGINRYQALADVTSLSFAENDAKALYDLLLHKGFDKEHCCLLLGSEATQVAIQDALRSILLTKARKDDLVVFYFAGHGLPISVADDGDDAEQPSEAFLTCYDFDLKKIMHDRGAWLHYPLRMGQLRTEYFELTRSRKVLFIFDCCHSGDFFGAKYRDRGIDNLATRYIQQPFAEGSTGRIVLSSCLPHQRSRESRELEHGLFTHHLLEALEGHIPAVIRESGWVTVGSLFDYLADVLPKNQRPVKTGVEHDSFKLVWYTPPLSGPAREVQPEDREKHQRLDKELRLKAMLADHSGFMRDRLNSFVGRERELANIHERIAEKIQTGGYVTITGHAGQGKSSIIAKLVEEYGPKRTAFHFIPFNPGPDHQVSLLRNLMARLILKYDLPDLYVASESRPALRDYFPNVLEEVAAKGGHEVIFIDGLDQLEEEFTGTRDLSFLPNNPPHGTVFVLGTRPNDTLRPLELLKPHVEYQLPNLSRHDFDLILQHRQVQLNRSIADQFYQTMQENALYLDLVAKELAERGAVSLQKIITQLAHNPENLFSLAMARLKRHPLEWREVIKPILGVLLVAREPLGLRHIRQILGEEDDRLREGIERLGGLIAKDWQQRYSLFHLKLYEYLQQDEHLPAKEYIFATDEEEGWHKRLAQWCEQGHLSAIWQDVKHDLIEQQRRRYARQHYITHLYYAREWRQIFEVLDNVQYRQGKVRDDPSTRSYAQDVDLGRQVAAWTGWTLQEGIALLPHLWRYTLLSCSLSSRADTYTPEAFKILLSLNLEKEALGLVELLTIPSLKAKIMLLIANHIGMQPNRKQEHLQLLFRCQEIARLIKDRETRAEMLEVLGVTLAQSQYWEQAEMVIYSINWRDIRVRALVTLVEMLSQTQEWQRAEAVVRDIEWVDVRAEALRLLGRSLAQAQQWELADIIWTEAATVINTFEEGYVRAQGLEALGATLAQVKQWARAEAVIRSIELCDVKAVALRKLGTVLAQAKQWVLAEPIFAEAETTARSIEQDDVRTRALQALGEVLIQTGLWRLAEAVISNFDQDDIKEEALQNLGEALTEAQEWERAEAVIRSIERAETRVRALQNLGEALTEAQEWERAEAVIRSIEWDYTRGQALQALGETLVQNRQWERAQAVWSEAYAIIDSIEPSHIKAEALCMLGEALARAHQLKRAQAVWSEAHAAIRSITWIYTHVEALRKLGAVLVQAKQWKLAEKIWTEIEVLAITIKGDDARAEEIRKLQKTLIQAQQWERAEVAFHNIRGNYAQVEALCMLGETLAHSQQWERAQAVWSKAYEAIRHIKQREGKSKALHMLGETLTQAQQWERAASGNSGIEPNSAQTGAIGELGACVRAHLWKQAQAVWPLAEAAIQSNLGVMLAQTQQWERAEAAIRGIEQEEIQIGALRALVKWLIQAQQWERAGTVIYSIKRSDIRVEELRKLWQALAQAEQWNLAKAIWPDAQAVIEWSDRRAEVLRMIGETLVQTGQWEQAQTVWTAAELAARNIAESYARAKALRVLGKTFVQTHQWERALAIWSEAEAAISSIEDRNDRAAELRELSIALIEAQQWERAEALIRGMKPYDYRSDALVQLGRALVQAGQWERAEVVIRNNDPRLVSIYIQEWEQLQDIPSFLWRKDRKVMGVSILIDALIQGQQWEQAEAMIRSIKLRPFRAEYLRELGETLAQAHQWERAEAIWSEAEGVIRDIEDKSTRAEELRKLGSALAQAHQWERAETIWSEAEGVIRDIETNSSRVAAVRNLERTIFAHVQQQKQKENDWNREQERFNIFKQGIFRLYLHLVQHEWLLANTRANAIELLLLAKGFISFDPEIGLAFCNAFTWVDIFLKG